MDFWIISDVCSDLPREYVAKQKNFELIPMHYELDGVDKLYTTEDAEKSDEFYALLSNGSRAKTSQINDNVYYKAFKRITDEGFAVLCVTLSSGISGSYQSAHIAKNRLLEKNKEVRVEIVDALSGSLGQGLLLDYILNFRSEGHNLEETRDFALSLNKKIEHWITVNDLQHLFRGGRLSRTQAVLGTILKIQPLLCISDEGKLASKQKLKGRKNAVKELFNKLSERAVKEKQKVYIAHSACLDEAKSLKEMVETLPFVSEVLIAPIGCVIGAHTGPNTLAIFFRGESRN